MASTLIGRACQRLPGEIRIEATLSGAVRPEQAVTAADVQAVTFNTTRRRGYDERAVEEALDHYADGLARLVPFPPSSTAGH